MKILLLLLWLLVSCSSPTEYEPKTPSTYILLETTSAVAMENQVNSLFLKGYKPLNKVIITCDSFYMEMVIKN